MDNSDYVTCKINVTTAVIVTFPDKVLKLTLLVDVDRNKLNFFDNVKTNLNKFGIILI